MNLSPVHFLVVGVAKAGTTSLAEYLSQHPGIFIPERKECRYFSLMKGDYNGPGADYQNDVIRSYSDYSKLFEKEKVCGDLSNDYFYYYQRSIPEIIKRLGKDIPIFVILRNPVARAFSNYGHHIRTGWEKLTFREALEQEEYRKKQNWAWPFYYKSVSHYADALNAFKASFNNVHIFIYEERLYDQEFFDKIFNVLGLQTEKIQSNVVYNKSGTIKNRKVHNLIHGKSLVAKILKSPKSFLPKKVRLEIKSRLGQLNLERLTINEEDRSYLMEYFADDIDKCSEILERDLHKVWN